MRTAGPIAAGTWPPGGKPTARERKQGHHNIFIISLFILLIYWRRTYSKGEKAKAP
jgi:hypothetical protein